MRNVKGKENNYSLVPFCALIFLRSRESLSLLMLLMKPIQFLFIVIRTGEYLGMTQHDWPPSRHESHTSPNKKGDSSSPPLKVMFKISVQRDIYQPLALAGPLVPHHGRSQNSDPSGSKRRAGNLVARNSLLRRLQSGHCGENSIKHDWLVVLTILKNMKVNGWWIIPCIMENKKCLKPPATWGLIEASIYGSNPFQALASPRKRWAVSGFGSGCRRCLFRAIFGGNTMGIWWENNGISLGWWNMV